MKKELDTRDLLDRETIELLGDAKISDYEKMCVIQEKLSHDFVIPTQLEPGWVYAPCPHDQGCPKLEPQVIQGELRRDFIHPCKFRVRWTETRADERTKSVDRDGTLTGNFSYVILEKGERPMDDLRARILEANNNRQLLYKCW